MIERTKQIFARPMYWILGIVVCGIAGFAFAQVEQGQVPFVPDDFVVRAPSANDAMPKVTMSVEAKGALACSRDIRDLCSQVQALREDVPQCFQQRQEAVSADCEEYIQQQNAALE